MQEGTPSAAPQSTPPVTPPPTPPAPVVEAKKSSVMIPGLILVIILSLVGAGYLAFQNMQLQKQIATANLYTSSPSASPYVSPSPTTEASPSSSPSAGNGTISGTICYPASGIPAGKIEVKNMTSSEVTSFDNPASMATFSVNVPAGQYELRYIPTAYPTVIGYYTSCTGSEPACQDTKTKRSSIPVTVTASQTSQGVKLCDYYYSAGVEPSF